MSGLENANIRFPARMFPGIVLGGVALLAGGCLGPADRPTSPETAPGKPAGPQIQRQMKTGYYDGRAIQYFEDGGRAVVEGDILVDMSRISDGPRTLAKTSATGIVDSYASSRWPYGKIPYAIDPNLPNPERVYNAMDRWAEWTDLNFVPTLPGDANYLYFRPHPNLCASYVGNSPPVGLQYQPIELADGCPERSVIHEIGHAIGLYHEHTRADRDQWVRIDWSNLQPGDCAAQYQIAPSHFGWGGLDRNSIMLYSSYLCAIDPGRPTMTWWDGSIIQTNHVPSGTDFDAVKKMYPRYEYNSQFLGRDVGASGNGAAFMISGTSAGSGNYRVMKFNPQVPNFWSSYPGSGVRIDVDMSDRPWVVKASGTVERWTGSAYTRMGTLTGVKDIGIGASRSLPYGGVFALSSAVMNGSNYSVYSWTGSTWSRITSGGGLTLSVDPSGRPWTVNAAGQVHRWDGSKWVFMDTNIDSMWDVGIGADGVVYMSRGNSLHRKVGASNANSTAMERAVFPMMRPNTDNINTAPLIAVDGAPAGQFWVITALGWDGTNRTQGYVDRGSTNY